ncbi:MAG: hypothetical protein OXK81_06125 [Chloroflexota bacterium]|nr:hypothetical protein [Chloroflexota bacterium]MDE2932166.1 hypothetical protein [Chloroflexota bacterium]
MLDIQFSNLASFLIGDWLVDHVLPSFRRKPESIFSGSLDSGLRRSDG